MHIFICMYVCMYVCVCVGMYIAPSFMKLTFPKLDLLPYANHNNICTLYKPSPFLLC